MQVIKTSNYGELTFLRTWSNGQIHIGQLKDGGYCHIGGPSVTREEELRSTIPSGKDLEEALGWFENKDKTEDDFDGTCVCGKVCKQPSSLAVHQKACGEYQETLDKTDE